APRARQRRERGPFAPRNPFLPKTVIPAMRSLRFLACLFAVVSAAAQEPPAEIPQAGFFEMVNLVALKEPTFLRIGNFQLNGGEPIPAGGTSGVLAVKPGDYAFTLSNAAAKP